MQVPSDGEEEEVGDEESRNAVVQQVGETDFQKGFHLKSSKPSWLHLYRKYQQKRKIMQYIYND